MEAARFEAVTHRYRDLRFVVLGDLCLDRYLEIDPSREEVSIETNLPVRNVVGVRAQPGAAGTIINNLAALGIGRIYPIGFAGSDGEGFELWTALERVPGVQLDYFLRTSERRTFTYCKPLVLEPGKAPVELNRFDFKNWTPTPQSVQELLVRRLRQASEVADGVIVLDQVDVPETGVITRQVLDALADLLKVKPGLLVLADSRRGLRGYPPVIFKMNATELAVLTGAEGPLSLDEVAQRAKALATQNHQSVFVTLAERGILGVTAAGQVEHVTALPVLGEIDIVGAGDAVSANLVAALAAGAALREALELANAAASVVIHKLGTTGTANPSELRERLQLPPA